MQLLKQTQQLQCFIKQKLMNITVGQVIIGMCVVVLSVWCGENVGHIFNKYFQFETIISLTNEPPSSTEFPGITICAPTIFTPQKLAELYPGFKKELHDLSNILNSNTMPPAALDNHRWPMTMTKYESKALSEKPALLIIKELSIRPDELIESCVFKPANIRNYQYTHASNKEQQVFSPQKCTKYMQILESIYEGQKCFTFFSAVSNNEPQNVNPISNESNAAAPTIVRSSPDKLINKQTNKNDWSKFSTTYCGGIPCIDKSIDLDWFFGNASNEMHFDLNPSIEVVIRPLENDLDWNIFAGQKPIQMTVHPNNILQNRRDFLFFQVIRNNYYEITFTKKTTYLLPAPYKTDCIWYNNTNSMRRKAWLSDGQLYKPKTRDDCISTCIKDISYMQSKCVNYYSVLIAKMFDGNDTSRNICEHERQNYTTFLEARKNCEQHCSNECIKSIFEINGRVLATEGICLQKSSLDSQSMMMKEPMITKSINVQNNDNNADDKRNDFDDYDQLQQVYSDEVDEQSNWYKDSLINANAKGSWKSFQHYTIYGSSNQLKSVGGQPRISPIYRNKRNVELKDSSNTITNDDNKENCKAIVSIRISPKPFTIVTHQPAISYESFLGTVGGHIGIWLGLSLYKIIKIVVHTLYNILYSLVNKFVDLRSVRCCLNDDEDDRKDENEMPTKSASSNDTT